MQIECNLETEENHLLLKKWGVDTNDPEFLTMADEFGAFIDFFFDAYGLAKKRAASPYNWGLTEKDEAELMFECIQREHQN